MVEQIACLLTFLSANFFSALHTVVSMVVVALTHSPFPFSILFYYCYRNLLMSLWQTLMYIWVSLVSLLKCMYKYDSCFIGSRWFITFDCVSLYGLLPFLIYLWALYYFFLYFFAIYKHIIYFMTFEHWYSVYYCCLSWTRWRVKI